MPYSRVRRSCMTSELRVTTLSNATGNGPAALTSQSAAKVLEKHNDSHTINNSLNVSTLTDNGTGDTTVNYTNSTENIHQYVTAGTGNNSTQNRLIQNIATQTHTTSSHRYLVSNSNFNATDTLINNSVVHGDLA